MAAEVRMGRTSSPEEKADFSVQHVGHADMEFLERVSKVCSFSPGFEQLGVMVGIQNAGLVAGKVSPLEDVAGVRFEKLQDVFRFEAGGVAASIAQRCCRRDASARCHFPPAL